MRQWNLGIDMGSACVRAVTAEGAVTAQSAAVALRKGEAFAFGEEAFRLVERAVPFVETGFPYENGALANEKYFCAWIRCLLRQLPRGRTKVLFAVPLRMSVYERKHTAALLMQSGASDCAFVASETAALLGSGGLSDRCAVVCDVGAGHIACSAMTQETVLKSACLPYGLAEADRAIVRMLEDKHHMCISRAQAEEAKKTLASLKGLSVPVKGLCRASGFPRESAISSEDVAGAVSPFTRDAVRVVRAVLAALSPECLEDLTETGITLVGGGAQTAHLEEMLAGETRLPVRIAPECENACVLGLGKIMTEEQYEQLAQGYEEIMKGE